MNMFTNAVNSLSLHVGHHKQCVHPSHPFESRRRPTEVHPRDVHRALTPLSGQARVLWSGLCHEHSAIVAYTAHAYIVG